MREFTQILSKLITEKWDYQYPVKFSLLEVPVYVILNFVRMKKLFEYSVQGEGSDFLSLVIFKEKFDK